ncbi:MAG: hypothetical protein IPP94_09880 [Ignavibacteria bacterium]|nr:hypothetical protein [Ignavibacteria bacterium]
MIPHRRLDFNAVFTTEKYESFLRALDEASGTHVDFRICETPVFIDAEFEKRVYTAALEILALTMTPEYHEISERSFPPGCKAPNENAHPEFVQVDFAVTSAPGGGFGIKLIELQGFPSLYGFQEMLGRMAIEHYGLEGLRHLAPGISHETYVEMLRRAVFGDHDPESVVLLEVEPMKQKTLCDFLVTERMIGVKTVDITHVEKEGRSLYRHDASGRRIPIRRIYNRAIIDEITQKKIAVPFSFTDDLDVEWACHPNWFYRISKFSIPYLDHPAVPKTLFLDAFDALPDDLENSVLKPLYSFAGSGVIVSPTRADVDAVPADQRGAWLLQEKVEYAPALLTPSGGTKVELRVMILWDKEPAPVMLLTRTGRGRMMGVDFNKNLDWVGATCCLVGP